MRKSIFEIVSENISIEDEMKRILTIAEEESVLCVDNYTYKKLFKFVDEYCFKYWEHRGHFINVDDYLKALNYTALKRSAPQNIDSLLTVIELVYNFWNLSQREFYDNEKGYDLKWCGNYYHLRDVMDDVLHQYNHIAFTNADKDCVLVIEDKQEVTAVAEIVPSAMAFDVIKYNHRSLQGEIELKKRYWSIRYSFTYVMEQIVKSWIASESSTLPVNSLQIKNCGMRCMQVLGLLMPKDIFQKRVVRQMHLPETI